MVRRLAFAALICTTAALGAESKDPLASLVRENASIMDVTMVGLALQLSQMAQSEVDALKQRAQETRFIPQQINAYYLAESSGKNIHIVATYRHADPAITHEKAEVICRRMISWVRFHLGLHDDGTAFARMDDVAASALYEFLGSGRVDIDQAKRLAPALDDQTVVMATVGSVGSSNGGIAGCSDSLVKTAGR